MIAPESIQFSAAEHRYFLNGEERPSVTTVLEREGLSGNDWWTEAARKRGTAVHKIALLLSHGAHGKTPSEVIENSLWDPSPDKTAPALVPYGVACAAFYADTGIVPVYVEQKVASLAFSLCGTLDLVGRLPNGRLILLDFKSGQPQAAAWIQTALYAMMLDETFGVKVDERTVVWLQNSGSYKMWPPRPPGGEDLVIGQCAVNLFHWRRAHKML